jgi:hypothetical protein
VSRLLGSCCSPATFVIPSKIKFILFMRATNTAYSAYHTSFPTLNVILAFLE